MKVLSCLAHNLSPEQQAELQNHEINTLKAVHPELFGLLSQCPDDVQILEKAVFQLMRLSDSFDAILLPLGSPAFMFFFALQTGLYNDPRCFDKYFFAHSVRESKEEERPDGSIAKTNVFRHIRFFNLRGSGIYV